MARVLIVEDEGIIALKTRMDLEQLGHEVIGVLDNGEDAIDTARREKPDIILMDIVLKGGLDGIEASGIVTDETGCKVIYMTALTDSTTVNSVSSIKHTGFLYKPFELFQLKKVIEEALRQ